jgi:hypothetical protein
MLSASPTTKNSPPEAVTWSSPPWADPLREPASPMIVLLDPATPVTVNRSSPPRPLPSMVSASPSAILLSLV